MKVSLRLVNSRAESLATSAPECVLQRLPRTTLVQVLLDILYLEVLGGSIQFSMNIRLRIQHRRLEKLS
jgi:hypothetical protein